MKAVAQDGASSSSSSGSAPDFTNLVLPRKEGIGAGVKKSTLCANHFELGTFKADEKLRTNILSGFCLDFRRAAECKIGICIYPNETFVYKPEKGHAVYIYEAGLPKQHANSVFKKIQIYVTTSCGKKKISGGKKKISCGKEEHKTILVGTLSKEHAKLKLDMMLPTQFELSHSGERKNVYFNAFELKCRLKTNEVKCRLEINGEDKIRKRFPEVYNHMKTNKDIWVTEVRPSEQPEFRPIAEGKIYNLLRVFSERTSKEDIQLFVESKGVGKSLGTISAEKTSIDSEFEFQDNFRLSHSSSTSTVVFWGYSVSTEFKLKDLTGDPSPSVRLQPPKKIVDGEYLAYQAMLATKTSGANIKRLDLVPMVAPVIRGFPRGALAESLEDKDTDAGGSIGH